MLYVQARTNVVC